MPAREGASDLVEFRHWHSLSVVGAGKTHLVGHDDVGYHLRGEDVLGLSIQQVVVDGFVCVFFEGHEESIVALLKEIGSVVEL